MKKSRIVLNFTAIIIILIVSGIYLWNPLVDLLSNLPKFRQFILSFDILAPIILIAIIAIQVLLAPIPGQIAGLAAGFVFGAFLGTLYSMMGLIIGSYIAFFLSKKFGRPLVEKFVNQKTLKKFDNFSSEKGVFALFLIYLLPALPDDAVCYIAGLSKIKIRSLLLISTIGRLPGFIVLNIIGAGFTSQNSIFSIVLFIILMIVSLALFLCKNKIEKSMLKIVSKFK